MSNSSSADYYAVLGVARDASSAEIKRSFRRLARECHPDVAGDSPEAVARFTQLREAYETLSDPKKRHAYDHPAQRMAGGMFYRRRWRPPGGHQFDGLHNGQSDSGRDAASSVRQRFNDPGNQMDLEDIFSQPSTRRRTGQKRAASKASNPRATVKDISDGLRDMMNGQGSAPSEQPPPRSKAPQQSAGRSFGDAGDDIKMSVDVPSNIARSGGTVTITYTRNKRGERGDGLFRYNEIHDLRIPSGTRNGQVLRVPKMGHAGARGGAYGDLVCTVRAAAPSSNPSTQTKGDRVVPISVVEALLGGRLEIDTAAGRVAISIPPGTSSGTRLRLQGRGVGGADVFIQIRIVVPNTLDAESRSLIERFAELNPESPRD